jgi:lysophospholipase L1-like esterase
MNNQENYKHIKRLFVSVLWTVGVSALLLEIALRIMGRYETLSEKVEGRYTSFYQPCTDSWFLIDSLTTEYKDTKSEFSFVYKKNSIGLFTKEIAQVKDPSKKRILVFGDSFTQGIGAPQDSSWPAVLQKLFYDDGLSCYEVYNAGIGGSDPFFAYQLLKEKLLRYHWDEVLFVVNGTDINEYVGRGGLERFNADGTTCFRKAPWFEFMYAHLRIVRCMLTEFFKYDYTLHAKKESQQLKKEGVEKIAEVILLTKHLCDSNDIAFCAIVHPGAADYSHPTPIEGTFQIFDIVKPLQDSMVMVFDLRKGFEQHINMQNFVDYAWPIDGHLKSKGYALFAKLVYENYHKEVGLNCETSTTAR